MTVYPELSRIPWLRAVVEEGDCLYLPYLWMHTVSAESAVPVVVLVNPDSRIGQPHQSCFFVFFFFCWLATVLKRPSHYSLW